MDMECVRCGGKTWAKDIVVRAEKGISPEGFRSLVESKEQLQAKLPMCGRCQHVVDELREIRKITP